MRATVADTSSAADELAAVYARMSGLLLSQETVGTALRLITALATETLPHVVGSGVTLVDADGHKVTAAASDPVVAQADALQYELDEGPCLAAWRDRAIVRIDDVETDPRWPQWSGQAAVLGMRATLSAPLVAGDRALGALKVYANKAAAFGGRDEYLLSMFAAQAAILVANVQTYESARKVSENLKAALRTREVIALAKGILIARDGSDEETALATLARIAAQRKLSLRETAVATVRTASRRRPPH
jgi:GAF domain-containing protein